MRGVTSLFGMEEAMLRTRDYEQRGVRRLGSTGEVKKVSSGPVLLSSLRSARRLGASEARFLCWVVAALTLYLVVAAVQPLLAFPFGTVPLFTVGGIGLAVVDRAAMTEKTG